MRTALACIALLLSLFCLAALGLWVWFLVDMASQFDGSGPIQIIRSLGLVAWLGIVGLGVGSLAFLCLAASLLKSRD